MGLSNAEWLRAADKSAAEHYGRKHARTFAFLRFGLPATLAVSVVGLLGWTAWWLWTHAAVLVSGDGPSLDPDLPGAFWVLAGILLVVTVVAYRPGRPFAFPSARIAKGIVISAAWLFLAGYAISSL